MINPPAKRKRNFWTGALAADAQAWLDAATSVDGSWWTTWVEWLDQYGGRKVAPPAQPGSAQFPVIEPAPGRYVLQRD